MNARKLHQEYTAKSNELAAIFKEHTDEQGEIKSTLPIEDVRKRKDELHALKSKFDEAAEMEATQNELAATAEGMKAHNASQGLFSTGKAGENERGAEVLGQIFKSVGHEVLGDPAMAAFLKNFEGRAPTRVGIQSPRVEVKTLLTGTSTTSAGAMTFSERKPILDMFYQRPLTVRDLITQGETGSDMVEYVRITGVTNNAAPVAEATATGDGTGAKPESAMALAIVQETVKTIAHWIPATNRALSDAAQLRTLIDSFLRYGLEEEVEDQILTGNGAGENFDGILHVSNTSSQAFDTNILTTTRKARTKVRTLGRANPTAWVMHPNDWQAIDLLQDNEARYYFGGPARPGQPMLWGLPVVESEGMTEGTTVVADWRMAIMWDRMQTAISVSNSHSDFFVRNLVAILAELRAAFGVIRPAAFVVTDLTA